MTKDQIDNLHSLSKQEKYEVAQMLWDDIAHEQSEITLPARHKKILDERLEKLNSGKAHFRTWEEIKSKYLSA